MDSRHIRHRVKESGMVARAKAEEFLTDITRPGIDGAGGSWIFTDFLMWFYACEKLELLTDLNHRIAATVREWARDHIEELGGQYTQTGHDGSRMIDRNDGQGLVPMEASRAN